MNIEFKSDLLQNKIPPANMNKVNIWKMWISSYLLGKIPWRRKYPFQYSHMGNRTDKGPDRLQSRGSQSQTWLSNQTTTFSPLFPSSALHLPSSPPSLYFFMMYASGQRTEQVRPQERSQWPLSLWLPSHKSRKLAETLIENSFPVRFLFCFK